MNGLGVPRLLQTLGESPAFVQLDDRAKSGRGATLYLASWATEAQKSRRPRAVGVNETQRNQERNMGKT